MPEYLLELRCLEMPPAFARRASRQLATRLFEDLFGRGLGPEEIHTGVTPRRLMVALAGLPAAEPDREERELGPPAAEAHGEDGEPSEALAGFAQRVGVDVSELEAVKTERGAYLAATRQVAGRPTEEVLAEIVPGILAEIGWARREGVGDPAWVRPLDGILSLFDGEVLPFRFGDLEAGGETRGHPILSPGSFPVEDLADYRRRLGELGIEPALAARRQRLEQGFAEAARELGGEVVDDPELVAELALGCEIPGVIAGRFPAACLSLPEELLIATLEVPPGALAVRREGELTNAFLAVMDRPDDPVGAVRAGHERAVAGRLGDARFHYENDQRTPLAERGRRLDQLGFRPRLGTYAQKVKRIEALVELILGELGWHEELETARQAVALAKADLTTDTVRENPALRGTAGGLLARQEGYVESVWQAVYDQYRPAASGAPIPRHRVGRALAVADRLDTLAGLYAVGPEPRASRDPYALRRLARGLLRILLEGQMELDLDLAAARAALLYADLVERPPEDLLAGLQAFLARRARQVLGLEGFAHDEVDAAMAVGKMNLPDLAARARALQEARGGDGFRSLVVAAKRIANMVAGSPDFELDPQLLGEEAEVELHRVLRETREKVDAAAQERRYGDGLHEMLALVEPLDRFFADVLVMDEDVRRRENRLALLQSCRRAFWRIARLKQIEVEKPLSAAGG